MSSTALLHPLTGAPLLPLGYRKDGRTIWPILGGAENVGEASVTVTPADGAAGEVEVNGARSAVVNEWDGKVESLPEPVQKIIREAREGEAKARTNAKATAAEEARQQMAQEIGKALGLIKGDEQADPAKLTEQLTAERTARQETDRKLAILELAPELGADAKRLMDSNSFLTAVRAIEPGDNEALKTAITTAVNGNAWLKAGRAPGASGADHAGGSGELHDPAASARPGVDRIRAAYEATPA